MTQKRRLVQAFAIFCVALLVLTFRAGYVQIVKGEEYKKLAVEQQTKDELVEAKRGDIVDRNGNKMAVSVVKYAVWVRPASVQDSKDPVENQAKLDLVAEGLSEILEIDYDELRDELSGEKTLIKVAKQQERATADEVREWAAENNIGGISISEETKRYYPLDEMAAQVLGSVTDDNNGLSGLELYYNGYLKGVPGRWIQNKDASGRSLSYGDTTYYDASDGATLVTTLDVVIQSYAEDAVKKYAKKYQADRVSCMVMETKTGEVLAMASTPSFNPNNSRVPTDAAEKAAFDALQTEQEQLDFLNQMWRNPLVNDTYIPGSTMKVMTASMALEEDLTHPEEVFVDNGYIMVSGIELKCVAYPDNHGVETLKKAVRNSCNPVFVQLAQRIGIEDFYSYLSLFGLDQPTGIDFPGEASSQIQPMDTAGPVGLATMGYGQGIAVTPIQQITAINAIGNDGKLVQPHLVKEIRSSDGELIKKIEPTVIRQTVSEETAATMCDIMEFVVSDGGAGNAQIEGYRIGGKTGTANIEAEGNKIIASFVGIAPIDDPKITLIFIVKNPHGEIYGSTVAAPGGREVLEQSLQYLGVPRSETVEAGEKTVTVPQVSGKKAAEAVEILKEQGLKYKISPDTGNKLDFTVQDQYPKGGSKIEEGGTVYIYSE